MDREITHPAQGHERPEARIARVEETGLAVRLRRARQAGRNIDDRSTEAVEDPEIPPRLVPPPPGVDVAFERRQRMVAGQDARAHVQILLGGVDGHPVLDAGERRRLELDPAAGPLRRVVRDRAVEDVEVRVRALKLHHHRTTDARPIAAQGRRLDDVRVPAAAEVHAAPASSRAVVDDRRVVHDDGGAEPFGVDSAAVAVGGVAVDEGVVDLHRHEVAGVEVASRLGEARPANAARAESGHARAPDHQGAAVDADARQGVARTGRRQRDVVPARPSTSSSRSKRPGS